MKRGDIVKTPRSTYIVKHVDKHGTTLIHTNGYEYHAELLDCVIIKSAITEIPFGEWDEHYRKFCESMRTEVNHYGENN